jgi:hypothetical protein
MQIATIPVFTSTCHFRNALLQQISNSLPQFLLDSVVQTKSNTKHLNNFSVKGIAMKKSFVTVLLALLSVALFGVDSIAQTFSNVWNPTQGYGKSVSAYYRAVAVDKRTSGTGAGRVYITSSLAANQKIFYWEKTTWNGSVTPITTPDGNFGSSGVSWSSVAPYGICVDDDGFVYVGDYSNKKIYKFDPTNSYAADSLKANGSLFVADSCFRFLHCTGSYTAGTLKLSYVTTATPGRVYLLSQNAANTNSFSGTLKFTETNDGATNYATLATADSNTIYVSSAGSSGLKGLVKYVYSGGVWSIAAGWPTIGETVHDINFHGDENALVVSIPGTRVFRKYSATTGLVMYGFNYGRSGIVQSGSGGAAAYDTSTTIVVGSTATLSWFEKGTYFTATPLSGSYYIPKGANPQGFVSLDQAFQAVNTNGLSGTVTFYIDADLAESGDVLALTNTTLNATNNLVIKPSPTKTPTITISTCPSTTGQLNIYTGLQLENASYVTIDGSNTVGGTTRDLTFKVNDATNGRYLIQAYANCDNLIFKNCIFKFQAMSSTNAVASILFFNGQTTGVCDNILIQNNVVGTADAVATTPYYGVRFTGGSATFYATNCTVKGNTIKAQMRALYYYWAGTSGTTSEFSGNTISVGSSTFSGYVGYGILLNTYGGTVNFFNNVIDTLRTNNASGQGLFGISNLSAASDAVLNIYNNIMTNFTCLNSASNTTPVYGIYLQTGGTNNIYYNSISLNTVTYTTGGTAGIRVGSTSAIANIKNNAISNTYNAASSYGLYYTGATLTSDNNLVYVPGASANFGYFSGARKTMADWVAYATIDSNSVALNPAFTSNSNLHIATGNGYEPIPGGTGKGAPVAGVTTDIDGETRDASKPDIGADEYGTINRVLVSNGTLTGGTVDDLELTNGAIATMSGDLEIGNSLRFTSGTLNIGANTLILNNPIIGPASSLVANATSSLSFSGTTSGLSFPSTVSTLKTLTVRNPNGLSVTAPLTLDSLALISGVLDNGTNPITISGTNANKVVYTSGSYVKGPLARTLPASLSGYNTYSFPVGKSGTYTFDLYNPITLAGGSVVVQAEVFDAATGGTAGAGLTSLNTNRYWNTSITSGASNFTNSYIKLSDVVSTSNSIGQCATQSGTYASVGGIYDGVALRSAAPLTSLGYFVIGAKGEHLAGGTYTVGPTGTYTSLTAAAVDLSNKILDGDVIVELKSDYVSTVETFPIQFFQNSSVAKVTIRPETGATGLVISRTDSGETIILNGVDGLVIDGRPGGIGTSKQLTIQNTKWTSVTPALKFINDATGNTVKYCTFVASDSSTSSGVIHFGTTNGTTGNDNNTIDNCDINANSKSAYGIYSVGTYLKENSGNAITNCNIFDNYISVNNASNLYAIDIYSNNSSWTITGNSIYQTVARDYVSGSYVIYYGIVVSNSGTGYVISNNYLGGSSANAGGSPWKVNSGQFRFYGISMTAGTGSPTSVQGNTITNFDLTTWYGSSTSTVFGGIQLNDGAYMVGTTTGNLIGSVVDTGAIRIKLRSVTSYGSLVTGLYFNGAGSSTISNNQVGGITLDIGTDTTYGQLYGTMSSSSATGPFTLSNNLIGSLTVPNSIKYINCTAIGSTTITMAGIRFQSSTATIQNNTISNLSFLSTQTGTKVSGIYADGGTMTIKNNTIRQITSAATNVGTGSGATLYGIQLNITTANLPHVISGNTIYGLRTTSTVAGAWTLGILFYGTVSSTIYVSVENNTIYGLTSACQWSSIGGIYLSTGSALCRNNMVHLGKDADQGDFTLGTKMWGIRKVTTAPCNIFNNTVLIDGSNVASNMWTAAFNKSATNTATDSVFNNIFVNKRANVSGTAKNFAVNLNTTSGVMMNYNVLTTTGAPLTASADSVTTQADMAAWKALGLDANGTTGDPAFMGANDLHINPDANPVSVASNAGLPLSNVPLDIDGNPRHANNPDIGADEFSANITVTGGTVSGGTYGNLSISSAASLSGNVTVTGNLTLSAPLSIGANTLVLSNPILGTPSNLTGGTTSNLTVSGTASGITIPASITWLNNLTVNNANGVTLSDLLRVNTLNLTNGNITTGTVIVTAGTVTGGNSNSFVGGGLRRPINAPGTVFWPIGKGSDYLPFWLTINTMTGADTMAIIVNDRTQVAPAGGLGSGKVLRKYYHISVDGTLSAIDASATLSYSHADLAELGVTNQSSLKVFKWYGSYWGEVAVTSIDTVANTIAIGGVTGVNDYIIAANGLGTFAFSKNDFNLGNVHFSTESSDSVYVRNTGTSAINIGSVTSSDTTRFNISPTSTNVNTGDSAKFVIKFKSLSLGAKNATFAFVHDANSSPDTLKVGATSVSPAFSTWANTIDFGFIDIKNMVIDTMAVKNSGTEAMTITNVVVSDTNFAVHPTSAGPIAIGDSAIFTFKYDPSTPGVKTASAAFTHNGVTGVDTVHMTGKSEYPVFSPSHTSISYGDVALNVLKKDSIVVTNTSTVATLNVSTVEVSNTKFSVMPITAVIAPSGSAKFYIGFTPTDGSVQNGTVIFTHDAQNMKDTIGVNGKGALPGFTASKRLVDFGNTAINTFKTDSIMIRNTSISALIVDSVKHQSQYFSIFPMMQTINSGDTAYFAFKFSPLVGGQQIDTVVFYHNASSAQDTVIATGVAITPTFASDKLGVVNLGSVRLGKIVHDTIVVSNATIATLKIDSIKVQNTEEYVVGMAMGTVDPSGTLKVPVAFSPKTAGVRTSTVVFFHNGVSLTDTVHYSGIGIEPKFAANTSSLAFGDIMLGNSKKDSIYVKNTGTDTLHLGSVISTDVRFGISSATAALASGQKRSKKSVDKGDDTPMQFAASISIANIAPFDSVKFYVTFTPDSLGLKTGNLVFTHDAATMMDTVNVSGTGVMPAFVMTKTTISFGNVRLTATKSESLYVKNPGTYALTVSSVVSSDTALYKVTPASALIQPGDSTKVKISFAPKAQGTRDAKILLTHNAPKGKDTISVTGVGVTPIFSSVNNKTIGTTLVSQTRKDSILVKNAGMDTLIISGFTSSSSEFVVVQATTTLLADNSTNGKQRKASRIADAEESEQAVTSAPAAITSSASLAIVLKPADSVKFYITFTPTAAGVRTGDLIFTHNALKPADTIKLSGTGVDFVPINQARLTPDGNIVIVEGIVTRALGSLLRMQDATAGLVVGQSSGALFDSIKTGGVKQGDKIRVMGKLSTYGGLKEIYGADVQQVTMISRGNAMPSAKLLSLRDIKNKGENYESQIIQVRSRLTVVTADTMWKPSTNYAIVDSTDNTNMVSIRIDNWKNTAMDSTSLWKTVIFNGVLTQYTSLGPLDTTVGYQLLPILTNDLIKDPTSDIDNAKLVPQEFALEQNYPNPFNPSTTIKYSLVTESKVMLTIFNILGQEVVSPVNEVQKASFYRIVWNGKSTNSVTVPTGVYFYRIVAEPLDKSFKPFIVTKKMIMMK